MGGGHRSAPLRDLGKSLIRPRGGGKGNLRPQEQDKPRLQPIRLEIKAICVSPVACPLNPL